jgi:hypothetical protein
VDGWDEEVKMRQESVARRSGDGWLDGVGACSLTQRTKRPIDMKEGWKVKDIFSHRKTTPRHERLP